MTKDELPVGFAMALAMNPEAMGKFGALSEEQKQQVIAGAHGVKSKDEMRNYVDSFAKGKR